MTPSPANVAPRSPTRPSPARLPEGRRRADRRRRTSRSRVASARRVPRAAAPQTWPAEVDPAKLDSWLAIHADGTVTAFTGKMENSPGQPNGARRRSSPRSSTSRSTSVQLVMGDTARTVDQGSTVGSLTIGLAGPSCGRRPPTDGRRCSLSPRAARRPGERAERHRTASSAPVGDPSRKVSYGGARRRSACSACRSPSPAGPAAASGSRSAARSRRRSATTRSSGTSVPRVDIPAKVTGEDFYVQDVRLPGMLHGRVIRPPGLGSQLLSVGKPCARGPGRAPEELPRRGRRDANGTRSRPRSDAEGAVVGLGRAADDGRPLLLHPRDAEPRGRRRREHGDAGRRSPRAAPVQRDLHDRRSRRTARSAPPARSPTSRTAPPRSGRGRRGRTSSGRRSPTRSTSRLENVRIITFDASGCYGRNGSDMATVDAALMSQLVGRPGARAVDAPRRARLGPEGPGDRAPAARRPRRATGTIVGWDHEAWIPAFFETTVIGSVLAGRTARMPSLHLWEGPMLYDIPASRQSCTTRATSARPRTTASG